MNIQRRPLQSQLDAKLADQFRYFRQEFLEAASSLGVPVPLDMVEDKSGKLFTFIEQRGFHYIFQIMHSHPESPHLLRCSLALMIVTISLLKGKMMKKRSPTDKGINVQAWLALLSENASIWASNALTSIADGGSVAICINLLKHDHSQNIQELILNLLARLVELTDEAANQMLLFPAVRSKVDGSQKGDNNEEESLVSSTKSETRKFSPTRRRQLGRLDEHYTCLSHMFAVISKHRNRYMVMTACANVILGMIASRKSPEMCEAIARTNVYPFNGHAIIPCKQVVEIQVNNIAKKAVGARAGKSLSLKPLKVSNKVSGGSGSAKGGGKGIESEAVFSTVNDNIGEWAGLKLMLKFLKRFLRYIVLPTNSGVTYDQDLDDSDDERAEKPQPILATAATPQHYLEMFNNAHGQVLLAVCELINHSPAVASFVIQLPGATRIVNTSIAMHKHKFDLSRSLNSCSMVLSMTINRINLMDSSQKHSEAYFKLHPDEKLLHDQQLQMVSQQPKRNAWLILKNVIRNGGLTHLIQSLDFSHLKESSSTNNTIQVVGTKNDSTPDIKRPGTQESFFGKSESISTIKDDGASNKSWQISRGSRPGTAPDYETKKVRSPTRVNSQSYNHSAMGQRSTFASTSLHRDLFESLPVTPNLPKRVEIDNVGIHGLSSSNTGLQDIKKSLKKSYSKQSLIMTQAYHSGFYKNGKMNIAMDERARRVYTPSPDPNRGGVKSLISDSSLYQSRPSTSQADSVSKPSSPLKPIHQDGASSNNINVNGILLDGLGRFEESYTETNLFQASTSSQKSFASFDEDADQNSVTSCAQPKLHFGRDNILPSLDILFP